MAEPDCPICGKPAAKTHIPFCSKRCADIDLGRWFKGSYAVPVVEEDGLPDAEENAENSAPTRQ